MQTLSKNSPQDNFKRLDQAELKAAISDWATDYPCIEKISLYRMKKDKVFPDDPKYVFVVAVPGFPPKSDRETESAQNIIKYYEETDADCSHIYHLMEDFYRIDKLPANQLPDDYQEKWFWFSIELGERIEDYEMVMNVEPLVLYERDAQPCSEASATEPSSVEPNSVEPHTAEPSTVEPNSAEDIDDFPENHNNSFTLKGDYWAIKYRGELSLLINRERIRYIIHMLEYPNREFYVHELIDLVKGHDPIVNQEYSKMDPEQLENEGLSLTEFQIEHLSPEEKSRLEDVAHNQWGALIKAKKLGGEKLEITQNEWDKMARHLLREYGVSVYPSNKGPKFNYKPRWKNNIEKARILVKTHIGKAIKDLRPKIPSLAEHLYRHIHTGGTCVYRPDPNDPIEWVIHW
jgi:hypothetical protein